MSWRDITVALMTRRDISATVMSHRDNRGIIMSGFDPAQLRQRYRQERDKRLRPGGNAQYLKRIQYHRYGGPEVLRPGDRRPPRPGRDHRRKLTAASFRRSPDKLDRREGTS